MRDVKAVPVLPVEQQLRHGGQGQRRTALAPRDLPCKLQQIRRRGRYIRSRSRSKGGVGGGYEGSNVGLLVGPASRGWWEHQCDLLGLQALPPARLQGKRWRPGGGWGLWILQGGETWEREA